MPHWKPAAAPAATSPGQKQGPPPGPALSPAPGDWPELQQLPVTCDPYLTWAIASDWRGQARSVQARTFKTDKQQIRVLLRAKSPKVLAELAAEISIAPIYLEGVPNGSASAPLSRFATATLHPSALTKLLGKQSEVEFELASAVRDQGGTLKGDAKGYFGQQTDLDISTAKNHVKSWIAKDVQRSSRAAPQTPAEEAPGTIAVFDYGCPFLRDQFMDSDGRSSRISALWHQETFPAEGPWQCPTSMQHGRVLEKQQLDRLIELSRQESESVDEASIYSGLNYLINYQHPRRRVFPATHGAHVLDMAGGSRNPLRPQEDPDAAARADLIFVQMPEDTAGDSSAASLGACLLDALRFTLANSPPQKPLVVNVSFGTTAGPHDGTSLIERAVDELLDIRRENFAVVMAAGNSRHMGLHCRRQVSKGHSALFRIHVLPGDRTDTFAEFWYPNNADLQFRARLPSGDWSAWVPVDDGVDLREDAGQEVVASIIHRRKVPNGKRSLMLLALRPTETPADDEGPLAPAGHWEVEVRQDPSVSQADAVVDAWIKRDDSRPYSGRVQSTFVGLDRSDADDTLNGLATGSHTLVASGFRWSNGRVVDYASKGPREREGQVPLIYGLCEWDSLEPGIRASAVLNRDSRLMNGTSVAAPVVARQAFNLMSAQPKTRWTKAALWTALEDEAKQPGSVLRTAQKQTG